MQPPLLSLRQQQQINTVDSKESSVTPPFRAGGVLPSDAREKPPPPGISLVLPGPADRVGEGLLQPPDTVVAGCLWLQRR